MFHRINIMIGVVCLVGIQSLYASHASSHHVRSSSWAIPVLKPAHIKKPSFNDKSYYESLLMDSFDLRKRIDGFLVRVDVQRGFDSMLAALEAFETAKKQVAELRMIGGKLKLYGTSIASEEMIKKSAEIEQLCLSYNEQLEKCNGEVFKDIKPLELQTFEHPAVVIDEMKHSISSHHHKS